MRRLGLGHRELVGLGVLIVMFGGSLLVFSRAINGLFGPGTKTVKAVFGNTSLLANNSPVRVNGVDVGEVTGKTLDPGGSSTVVTMALRNNALPLYSNATATIKWRTVLGGSYAVVIDRGVPSSGTLRNLTIPQRQTANQVELDQILTALGPGQRVGLRTILHETPQALADTHAPARLLSAVARVAPDGAVGVAALRGLHSGDLSRLVDNSRRTIDALGGTDGDLRTFVQSAAGTLRTTAAREQDLRQTIVAAAATEPLATSTLTNLDRTLSLADPLVSKLNGPAPDVAPAARMLRPVLVGADTLLGHAVPLLRSLRPAVSSLAVAARVGKPLLDRLAPSIDRVANPILPRLAAVDPGTKRPTYEMLGPTIQGLGAAADQFDPQSHMLVFPATSDANPIDDSPCKVFLANPDATKLISCDALLTLLGGLFGGGTK
jgi:phospholipid/cholesterol/gamma-HCH transport system substrate-binding protein